VHDLLADQGAVAVVAVAADPCDARDLREAGPGCVGDPDGAADGAAVGAAGFCPAGCAACAAGLDGVEAGALKGRRVSLDEQEVVSLAAAVLFFSRDVLRGPGAGVGAVMVMPSLEGCDLGPPWRLVPDDTVLVERRVLTRCGILGYPFPVAAVASWLSLKTDAIMLRDKPKDAYDVVWLIDALGPGRTAGRIAASPLLRLRHKHESDHSEIEVYT
jgi:hypothetical protein